MFTREFVQITNSLINTPFHPEKFHFMALHNLVALHENSWGSSYYQGVMDPFNRPIDKAVWGKHRFWVSGRLPHFCMISLRFPIAPKMQKFAMTKCVSTISGFARYCRNFFTLSTRFLRCAVTSPRNRFNSAPRHGEAIPYQRSLGRMGDTWHRTLFFDFRGADLFLKK